VIIKGGMLTPRLCFSGRLIYVSHGNLWTETLIRQTNPSIQGMSSASNNAGIPTKTSLFNSHEPKEWRWFHRFLFRLLSKKSSGRKKPAKGMALGMDGSFLLGTQEKKEP
jgi:hypothetical protein